MSESRILGLSAIRTLFRSCWKSTEKRKMGKKTIEEE